MALSRVRHLTLASSRPLCLAASEVRARPTFPSGRRDGPLDRTLPGGFVLGRAPERQRPDGGRDFPGAAA
jgi:hypothetical protein